MHRILIGVAVAVVVLALGSVVAVGLYSANRSSPSVAPEVLGVGGGGTVAAVDVEPERPAPRRRPATRQAPPPAGNGVVEAEAMGVARAAEDVADADRDEKIRGILDSLTEDEQQAMMRAIGRRMMEERRLRQQYELPSDRQLRGLERNRNEAIRLSDVQRQQIEALKESMKPKIDAATSELRQRQEALREQAMQLMSSGDREGGRALFEQMGQLRREMEQATAPVDEEYKFALNGILTPEQQTALAAESASGDIENTSRRDIGGGRPGGNMNPGAGGGRRGGGGR